MAHLSDDEVLANLGSVIGSRRRITAQLVAYLGEVEARRLELREACSSMYEFCCRKLKLSEGSAHRHIAAARIARKYPMVLGPLREGRIHVTALSMLQRYLSVENHAELLAAACDKSKAEVELLIRSRFPRPDVADAIRPMPVQAHLGGDGAAAGQSVASDSGSEAVAPAAAGQSAPGASGVATVELHEPRPRVSPLAAQRFHIQFSAGPALKEKLERALDLMSHSNPKQDLATVIERGLDLLLADLEKKKHGKTNHPRQSRGTKHGEFSREARREIYERDGERCTYVSPSGERCRARAFVQLDHGNPRALGGAGTTDNGRLLCRAHNLFEAEKVFGGRYIESRIRRRQQRLGGESRRAAEEDSAVLTAGGGAGPESPRQSSVQEVVERDSVGGAIRLRQQRLDGESRHGHGQTSGGSNADPPTLADALTSHPGDTDETATSHAPSCASDDANRLRASESLRCLEHEAGGAAEPGSELWPRGEARDQMDSTELESKLLSALTNMGFRRGESKRAVAALGRQETGNARRGALGGPLAAGSRAAGPRASYTPAQRGDMTGPEKPDRHAGRRRPGGGVAGPQRPRSRTRLEVLRTGPLAPLGFVASLTL